MTDDAVVVRPARDADRQAVARLHEAAVRAHGPTAYDDEQVDAWASGKDPAGYPLEGDGHFLVAVREGTVVGFGHFELDDSAVRAVYVHPDHARTGLGTAILERLEARARGAGHQSLRLVASTNAVGFYERRGWEPGPRVEHETSEGVVLECREMRKRLDG